MMHDNSSKKVVILGGGIGGMMAAYKLAQTGFNVCLIESKGILGGLSTTIKLEDCYFDLGPHAFHVQIERAVNEIKYILKDELATNFFNSEVYFMNKYMAHPLTLKDVLLSIKPSLAAQSIFDFIKARVANKIEKKEDASFTDWVVNRFGRKLHDIYFGSYTQKVWGRDPKNLTSTFASARIPVTSLGEVMRKMVFGSLFEKKHGHSHSPYGRKFYYPKREGIGRLISVLQNKLETLGVEIHLDSHVRNIVMDGKKVKKVICRYPSAEKTIECDYLLSTIPITDLVKAVRPFADEKILKSADKLSYRALILLFLIVNKDRITKNNWINFAPPDIIFNRLYETKNFSEDAAPQGKTGICLEVTCEKGDKIWNMQADELYKLCEKDLEKSNFLNPKDISYYSSEKIEQGYTVYEKGYEDHLVNLIEYFDNIENLITFGRQGLFTYTNMDHSVDMAISAADYLWHPENFKTKIRAKDLFHNYILSY